jgi:hypothetical protein
VRLVRPAAEPVETACAGCTSPRKRETGRASKARTISRARVPTQAEPWRDTKGGWCRRSAGVKIPAHERMISVRNAIPSFRTELIMSKSQALMATASGLAAVLLAFAACAQDAPRDKAAIPAPGPDTVRSMPLQAPVGHRQPRISDLPPAPARNQEAGGTRDDINEKLRICRGC